MASFLSTFWVSISKSIYSCLLSLTPSNGSLFCNVGFFNLYKLPRLSFFVGFYFLRKYYYEVFFCPFVFFHLS